MLMKFLAVVVFWAGVGYAYDACVTYNGRKLVTFAVNTVRVNIPCKYNAIRDTVCGDWNILVTPTVALDHDYHKYYTKGLWVGVKNLRTNKGWQGLTSVRTARGYIEGKRTEPFRKRNGLLATGDVFNFTRGDNYVSLIEREGQFRVDFGLYEDEKEKNRNSGFRFECNHPNFQPTPYPTQLCGNGSYNELIRHSLREHKFGNVAASRYYHVFTDPYLVQMDSDCARTARIMTGRCKGEAYKAAERCWVILGLWDYYSPISKQSRDPMSAFKHCVEFVCSGYKDPISCIALRDELEGGPSLYRVSEHFPGACGQYPRASDTA